MKRKSFFQKIAIGHNNWFIAISREENSKARFLQLFTWVSDEKIEQHLLKIYTNYITTCWKFHRNRLKLLWTTQMITNEKTIKNFRPKISRFLHLSTPVPCSASFDFDTILSICSVYGSSWIFRSNISKIVNDTKKYFLRKLHDIEGVVLYTLVHLTSLRPWNLLWTTC